MPPPFQPCINCRADPAAQCAPTTSRFNPIFVDGKEVADADLQPVACGELAQTDAVRFALIARFSSQCTIEQPAIGS